MLSIQATVQGDRLAIKGLSYAAGRFPSAIERGLEKVGKGVFREAFDYLSGPGAKKSKIPPGGYPVPVRTGHLRRSLSWLKPGQTKSAAGLTFTAGKMEIVVYNSAEYSRIIHEGQGSSSGHGARQYLTDGFNRFNGSNRCAEIIDGEVQKVIGRGGF